MLFRSQAAADAGAGVNDATGSAMEGSAKLVRRLTTVVDLSGTKYLQMVVVAPSAAALASVVTGSHVLLSYPIKDNLQNVGTNALGALVGATPWTLEGSAEIPEVELKVDSFSITARTRKLKAQWTPDRKSTRLNSSH